MLHSLGRRLPTRIAKKPRIILTRRRFCNMSQTQLDEHLVPKELPILFLDAAPSFAKLTAKEKKYAHYMALGKWLVAD